MNNDLYRRRLNEHQEKVAEEREFWNKKKASIQEGFMKELNEGDSTPAAQATPTAKASETSAVPAAPSVQGSDDDAVLVEADPSNGTPASGGGGGKKKKGKGKK